MIEQPTPQQIQFYRDNGFVAIEGMFVDELDEWRRVTGEAVRERLASRGLANTNQVNPDDYYARVFTQCLRLADTHAGMRRMMFDPRIGKFAATLAGVDGIRVWHDQALIKPPQGNPTSWHLDNPYWS
ncbi:MAG: phytanoyl-CoA dioxygenase family protein, partial [Tepidisphaeraceae bacterium]